MSTSQIGLWNLQNSSKIAFLLLHKKVWFSNYKREQKEKKEKKKKKENQKEKEKEKEKEKGMRILRLRKEAIKIKKRGNFRIMHLNGGKK